MFCFDRYLFGAFSPKGMVLGLALLSQACWSNPFAPGAEAEARQADRLQQNPGQAEREVDDRMEEHPRATPATTISRESAFDLRLLRVDPERHLDTEESCDVSAVGELLRIPPADLPRYPRSAGSRLSVRCSASTGDSWADLFFSPTNASNASEVQPGKRIRVRLVSPDGGYFDYPILEFRATDGDAAAQTTPSPNRASAGPPPTSAFDLRRLDQDPKFIDSRQKCALSYVGEIDLVRPEEARRRRYPLGVRNRMTVRCRHAAGESWADLVFAASQAPSALAVRRGTLVDIVVVSRNGGSFDYPVLRFEGLSH